MLIIDKLVIFMDNNRGKKKIDIKTTYKIAAALTSVMQTALSLLVPVFICIFAAKYLTDKFRLPPFVMIVGIVFGAASGFYSMIKYITSTARTVNRDDDDAKQ